MRLLTLPLLAAAMVIVMPMAGLGSLGSVDTGRRAPPAMRCPDGDVPCLMRSAAEAERQGQLHEAEAIYRNILAADPLQEAPYRALVDLTSQRPLTKASRPYHTTRQLLDGSFREYETRRFIVLSNADAAWSRTQAEHLERAHHQFLRFAGRLRLRPLPLRHKLVCVLFEHQREYRAFASAHDDIHDPWIVGHYSPRHDRVVFFHRSEHDPNQPSAQAAIATTVHEAIHQLHFHTRIKSLQVQYPLWICEGLATAFETAAPNQAFGPDHEYTPRRDRFQLLLQQQELLPLRELAVLTQLDEGHAGVAAVYHQSYAFVTWASRHRPAQLRDYLVAMLQQPPGKVDEERHLAIFQQAFGNVDAVEQQWLMHERQLLARRGAIDPNAIAACPEPLHECACLASTLGDDRLSYLRMAYARSMHK